MTTAITIFLYAIAMFFAVIFGSAINDWDRDRTTRSHKTAAMAGIFVAVMFLLAICLHLFGGPGA